MRKFFQRKWALPLSIFLALFLLLAATIARPDIRLVDRKFEGAEWKKRYYQFQSFHLPGDGEFRRAEMVEDLRAHFLKIGMKRSQIRHLLGPPDVVDGTGDHGEFGVYSLDEAPARFKFWQWQLQRRYGRAQPTLAIEYDKTNRFVIGIGVN